MPAPRTAGLGLLGVLALAGCAVGPTTRMHPEPIPAPPAKAAPLASQVFLDSLATSNLPATPAALAADTATALRWLELLQDSQLVALVRTALLQNRDLQAATARVREYRAQLGVARGDLFPRLDANASASTNRIALGAFPPAEFDAVRVTADLQWELDFWGKLRRQTQAARLDWSAREDDRQAVVLTLVSDLVTAYLELGELDQNVRVSEQTLESRSVTLRLARQRFAQGVISELDVRQFEADLAGPAARVAEFARLRAQKEHQLAILMGQAPGVGPIPRGRPLQDVVRSVAPPDSVSSALLARRPDVLGAMHEWSAAAARVPRVTLSGSYGRQKPQFDGLFAGHGEVYAASAGISLPVFTGGRLLAQQHAAQARADQARLHYEQTVLTALQEASDALVGVRLSREQLAAQETQARALRRAVALAEERYRAGISSYLEVLDAQRGVFNAELELAQVQRQYLVATVQLYKALGGSWEAEDGKTIRR